MSEKKHKSAVEVLIDIVVEYVRNDIQEVLDLLPESEGDDDE